MSLDFKDPDEYVHDRRRIYRDGDDGSYYLMSGGVSIVDPFVSTCGRFKVSPEVYGFVNQKIGGFDWALRAVDQNGFLCTMRVTNWIGDNIVVAVAWETEECEYVEFDVLVRSDDGDYVIDVIIDNGPDSPCRNKEASHG